MRCFSTVPSSCWRLLAPPGSRLKTYVAKPRRLRSAAKIYVDTPIPPRPFFASSEVYNEVREILNKREMAFTGLEMTRSPTSTLCDKDVIDQVIDKAGLRAFKGKTIIEVGPGVGFLSERLLQQVQPKKYIAIEHRKPLQQFVTTLKSDYTQPDDKQATEVFVRKDDGYNWGAFSSLEDEGILTKEEHSHTREEVNPNIILIATLKPSQADMLVAQWVDTFATRSWLQKYGRVRLLLFVPVSTRLRMLAEPGSTLRTKGSFVKEALCEVREILHTPDTVQKRWISNTSDHFDAPQPDAIVATTAQFAPASVAQSLLEFIPYEHTKITAPWSTFDFLLKALLIHRNTPVYRQIGSLASGAYAILANVPAVIARKVPQDMTIEDVDTLAHAYDAWPFKPDINSADYVTVQEYKARGYAKQIRDQSILDQFTESSITLPSED